MSKKEWEKKNARRIFLIWQELGSGLTPTEAEELECLDTEATEYFNAIALLPIEQLERWEAMLKEAKRV